MKRLLLFLLLLFPVASFSQPHISYSESFPVPEKGDNKILILPNGNTVWMNFDNNFKVRVYDKQHKLVHNKFFPYKHKITGKGAFYSVKDAFVNEDKLVVFIRRDHERIISMHRIIVDLNKAEVESIEELGRTTLVADWGFDLDYMVLNNAYIERDPVTNGYALLIFNGYDRDTKERVTVKVYNAQHQLVKEVLVNTPAEQGRFVHMSGFSMYDNTIYVGTHVFDPKLKKDQELPFYLSKLSSSADAFETKQVSIKPYQIKSTVDIRMNPVSKKLQLLSNTDVAEQHTIGRTKNAIVDAKLTIVDPNTLSVVSSTDLSIDKLDNDAKTKLGDKKGFAKGVFKMHCYDNGTTLFVPEEKYEVAYRSGGGSSYTKEYVSKLGFVTYNSSGTEVSSFPMYIRRLAQISSASEEYFEYRIFQTDNGYYLIMNDLIENMDKPVNKEPHVLSTISDADGVIYKINNGNIDRTFMFGKPTGKKESNFIMVSGSTYDDASKTIATIVVERRDRNKIAKLAWVEL